MSTSENKYATEKCGICMDAINSSTVRTLTCFHMFHEDCISSWVTRHGHCPYCRTRVQLTEDELELSWHDFVEEEEDVELLFGTSSTFRYPGWTTEARLFSFPRFNDYGTWSQIFSNFDNLEQFKEAIAHQSFEEFLRREYTPGNVIPFLVEVDPSGRLVDIVNEARPSIRARILAYHRELA